MGYGKVVRFYFGCLFLARNPSLSKPAFLWDIQLFHVLTKCVKFKTRTQSQFKSGILVNTQDRDNYSRIGNVLLLYTYSGFGRHSLIQVSGESTIGIVSFVETNFLGNRTKTCFIQVLTKPIFEIANIFMGW